MPRIARVAPGGFVYHVINRANGRLRLFRKEADFLAFEDVILQAHERHSIPILAWCMVQEDAHLLTVLRYVEHNPLRAHVRLHGPQKMRRLLSDWPVERPRNLTALVNEPQTQAEVDAVQSATKRGRPLGTSSWVQATAARHNLQSALRPRGRQKGWRKQKCGRENEN